MLFKEYKKSVKINSESVEVSVRIEVDDDEPSILMDQDFETPEQREESYENVR